MITLGAIVLSMSLLTHVVFVQDTPREPTSLSKEELNAMWADIEETYGTN